MFETLETLDNVGNKMLVGSFPARADEIELARRVSTAVGNVVDSESADTQVANSVDLSWVVDKVGMSIESVKYGAADPIGRADVTQV